MPPGMKTDAISESSKPNIASSSGGQIFPKSPPRSLNGLHSLAQLVEAELETLREEARSEDPSTTGHVRFPAGCQATLFGLEGNSRCIDCGASHPQWAALSYGALVCLQCAGVHRSLGVNISTVRSVTMDHWRYEEVVKMMEGGNRQLSTFFDRHALGRECSEFHSPQLTSENVSSMRYKTKAALFYRQHLDRHVQGLLDHGLYKGRRRPNRRPIASQSSMED